VNEDAYWKSRCGAETRARGRCRLGGSSMYGGRCRTHRPREAGAAREEERARAARARPAAVEPPMCAARSCDGSPCRAHASRWHIYCQSHLRSISRNATLERLGEASARASRERENKAEASRAPCGERKRLVLGKPIVPRCTHVDDGGARCFAFVDKRGACCDAHRPRVEPSTRSRCAHVGRSGFRCGNVATRGTHCAMHEVVVQEAAE
jgi:hypothetical protein